MTWSSKVNIIRASNFSHVASGSMVRCNQSSKESGYEQIPEFTNARNVGARCGEAMLAGDQQCSCSKVPI